MQQKANVDVLSAQGGSLSASGPVAMRLLESGFNVNALRTNDVLRKDEWKQYDQALIEVARDRLPLVNLLVSRGLTYNIPNGLGTTILEWETVSDMEPAEVSLAGVTRGTQDTLDFTLQSMPLPIIHKDFTLNIRKLEASRRTGQPLDMAQLELATRLVAEKTESMVIAGHTLQIGTSTIKGLATEANRNTGSVTANWASATGAQIVGDVLTAIAALQNDNMYGPYSILVPYDAYRNMYNDFKTESDKTIAQRVMEIPGITEIVPSQNMPAGEVIFVQLSRDVIDEVIGMQPTVVQWESMGGLQVHFKVMSIMVPRVRSTYTGQSGIMHLS